MLKELYERLLMDVTEFDVEDVIATSGEPTDPVWTPGEYESGPDTSTSVPGGSTGGSATGF